jgi:hypothetical protein
MNVIILLLVTIVFIYIINQIFVFYDIDLSVILPYLTWVIALILFYLLLGQKNKPIFSEN